MKKNTHLTAPTGAAADSCGPAIDREELEHEQNGSCMAGIAPLHCGHCQAPSPQKKRKTQLSRPQTEKNLTCFLLGQKMLPLQPYERFVPAQSLRLRGLNANPRLIIQPLASPTQPTPRESRLTLITTITQQNTPPAGVHANPQHH